MSKSNENEVVFDNRYTGAVFPYSKVKGMRGIFVLDDPEVEYDAWLQPDGLLRVMQGRTVIASGMSVRTPSENPKAPVRRVDLVIHASGEVVSLAGWKSYKKADTTTGPNGERVPNPGAIPYTRLGPDKPLQRDAVYFE